MRTLWSLSNKNCHLYLGLIVICSVLCSEHAFVHVRSCSVWFCNLCWQPCQCAVSFFQDWLQQPFLQLGGGWQGACWVRKFPPCVSFCVSCASGFKWPCFWGNPAVLSKLLKYLANALVGYIKIYISFSLLLKTIIIIFYSIIFYS